MSAAYATVHASPQRKQLYAFFIASLAYAFSIQAMLSLYAAPNWPIFSFPYAAPTVPGYTFLVASLGSMCFFVPKHIDRPSNLVIIFAYIFIIIPLMTATICMEQLSPNSYFVLAIFTCFCFILLCVLNGSFAPADSGWPVYRHESSALPGILLYGFLVLASYLIYRFGSVMNLVGLDSLYEQRALGKASNLVDGYAQSYSQFVFSTGLLALGLFRNNKYFIVLGFSGALLNYAITAEKAGILFPIFIVSLYFILTLKSKFVKSTIFFMTVFAIFNFVSALLYNYNSIFEVICINFGVRATLVPGVFTLHYLDYFTDQGFTYFSQIRGLNLIFPTPAGYVNDPNWPILGLMVGEDYIGYQGLNANVNFIAFDGIASLGTIGIIVPFIVVFAIIRAFDYLAKGISLRLCLPILTPIALTLSNSSAFSVLTSFGGFFWLLVFKFLFSPAKTRR